jgi:hypothetical protein
MSHTLSGQSGYRPTGCAYSFAEAVAMNCQLDVDVSRDRNRPGQAPVTKDE